MSAPNQFFDIRLKEPAEQVMAVGHLSITKTVFEPSTISRPNDNLSHLTDRLRLLDPRGEHSLGRLKRPTEK